MVRFEPTRALTFAEKKINWQGIIDITERLNTKLESKIAPIKQKIIDGTIDKRDAQVEIASIITAIQLEAFNYGKQISSKNMKLQVKKTNSRLEGVMYQQNVEQVGSILNRINQKNREQSGEAVFSLDGILSSFFGSMKTLFITGAINLGREVVFEENKSLVYAFEYSAILDGRTSDICLSLDGLVMAPTAANLKQYSPPVHYNCRSILVEILNDDPYRPNIDVY